MKELYNEYFHIPKHGKIRDKVMLIRTAITAIIMIVCLAAMSITAYAYFSHNVTSGSNIIKAANFEADVFISITNETGEPIPVTEEYNHTKTALLKAGNTYHVVLDESTNSTAGTGFIIISSPDCQEIYHTQQLGNDESVESGRTEKIIFDLSVTADTTVCFVSHWGTSSHYSDFKDKGDGGKLYITNDNTGDNAVKMIINGVINSVSDSEDEEKETTSDETTSTETTPTEIIHTVAANETLGAIAKTYGVSVEQIAAYNNISNPNSIQAGQPLKIPPADYKVPADTTEQTTTTVPETTTPPETTVTESTETTAPAETTTATETTGTPETSAPAETTEPIETTTSIQEAQPTTENSESTGAPTTEANS